MHPFRKIQAKPETAEYSEIPGWDMKSYRKAERRVGTMTDLALLGWAEDAVVGMGRGLDDYRKHGSDVSLLEIRQALGQLWSLNEELLIRYAASQDLRR